MAFELAVFLIVSQLDSSFPDTWVLILPSSYWGYTIAWCSLQDHLTLALGFSDEFQIRILIHTRVFYCHLAASFWNLLSIFWLILDVLIDLLPHTYAFYRPSHDTGPHVSSLIMIYCSILRLLSCPLSSYSVQKPNILLMLIVKACCHPHTRGRSLPPYSYLVLKLTIFLIA